MKQSGSRSDYLSCDSLFARNSKHEQTRLKTRKQRRNCTATRQQPPGEQLRGLPRIIAVNVEAHRVQREQMEEEWEEYQKEKAERLAKGAEHAPWLESRKEWIENFPYKPAYHPTYTFDDPCLVGEALRERLRTEDKEIERLEFKVDNDNTSESEEAA